MKEERAGAGSFSLTDVGRRACAFTAVSLEPLLVLFCAEKIARFHDAVLAAGTWAVSVLGEDGEKTARWLATRGRPLAGQLDALRHHPGPLTAAPILDDALAAMELVLLKARSTVDSWGETNRASLEAGQVKPDPEDPKGPLTLAAAATKDKTRLVVYGTANLAINQFLNVQNNRDFFLNTVSWLAEQEDQISIRPKDTRSTPVFLTSQQAQAVFLLPVVVLPGIVLIGGIVTFVRRRSGK